MTSLPQGVWSHIVELLAAEGAGEQWMIKRANKWQLDFEMNPLRALSQINKCIRAVALPAMWRNIKFVARNETLPNIVNLYQLARQLNLGGVDSRSDITYTSSLPLGPRNFVETIDIDIRLEETFALNDWISGRRLCDERALEDACQAIFDLKSPYHINTAGARAALIPWGFFSLSGFLNIFGDRLTGCPKLRHFGYRSSFIPPENFVRQVLRCKKLQSLSLDLGRNSLESITDHWLFPYDCICRDPRDRIRPQRLKHVALGLGSSLFMGFDTMTSASRDGRDYAVAIVDWLIKLDSLKHLSLAAPALLRFPWMLPLWAQLDELSVWTISGDRPGETLQDDELPLLHAAQRFPRILQDVVWPAFGDKSGLEPSRRCNTCPVRHSTQTTLGGLERLAKDIFDLIPKNPDLEVWKPWFATWEDTTEPRRAYEHVSTKTILIKVAEVLADKCAKTNTKRGLKRKTLHRPMRRVCPCQEDFSDEDYSSGTEGSVLM